MRVVRSEASAAHAVGERLLDIARERDDTLYHGAGHFTVGFASFLMGDFAKAADHAGRGWHRFETSFPAGPVTPFHSDVRVLLLCLASHAAWDPWTERSRSSTRLSGSASGPGYDD